MLPVLGADDPTRGAVALNDTVRRDLKAKSAGNWTPEKVSVGFRFNSALPSNLK